MDALDKARREIDAVDAELAVLFERRMAAVLAVAQYKQAHGLPIFDAAREKVVLDKAEARIQDPALRPYYRDHVQNMMDVAKHYEAEVLGQNRAAYQGVEGAFAHIALKALFPHAEAVSFPTWDEVFDAVERGDAAHGVVPFENSHAGDVSAVLDLCYNYPDLWVVDVYDLPISQNLLVLPGTQLGELTHVYSHQQAIAQSETFLKQFRLPATAMPNTAMAAKFVAESGDYAKTADLLRPGHADYTAYAKYHGFQDARGGGHFSGRITAALVAGGGIVLEALERAGIEIVTHIGRCAGVADTPFALNDPAALAAQAEALLNQSGGFALLDADAEEPMKNAIRAAGSEGDSVGGILETAILGLPAGVGEPYFDSVESEIAHMAFSVPAVKGIEFGTGFGFADQKGSEANDPFRMKGSKVVTATNHTAGLNGGISNGMPVVFRTVDKPTPSIYKQQDTVDYIAKQNAELSIQGRHDPCIVPRAAIVQTCAAALAVGDLLTAKYGMAWMEHPTSYRKEEL